VMGDHAAAALHAIELARLNPQQAVEQVIAASLVARCVPLAVSDSATPQSERADVAESYARQAVELLRQALARGFKELDKVRAAPAFSALHNRPDFKALAQP
jgi:hypothetical protein